MTKRSNSSPTHIKVRTIMFGITVGEYLEFEFRFKVAAFLGIERKQLVEYKTGYPDETKRVARHVLLHICTEQCRRHMLDRKTNV